MLTKYLTGIMDQAAKNVKTIVLPEGEDKRVLTAAHIVTQAKAAKIIILGDENEIKDNLMKLYTNTNCTAICVKHASSSSSHGGVNKMKLISKDDKAKQIAIDVGMNAAKAAIIAGKNEDEILPIVQDAIAKALDDYKPSVSMAKGVENASRIIENWEEKENIKNHIYS